MTAGVGRQYTGTAGRIENAIVALGLSDNEIADRLSLGPLTAKTHVSRAMTELACRERAGLVVFAYQTGLITVAPETSRPG